MSHPPKYSHSSEHSLSVSIARHPCTSCEKSKRKCDRVLPTCAYCARRRRRCVYRDASRHGTEILLDYQLHDVAGSQFATNANIGLAENQQFADAHAKRDSFCFPAVYFLDAEVFLQDELEIPRPQLTAPSYVKAVLGDISNIHNDAKKFFATIHTWWPFIFKQRFYKHLLNPLTTPRADATLLFLCMKVSVWAPQDEFQDPRNSAYLFAKQYFLELEMLGMFTLQTLQAGILLCLYEIGHGLYPSAYLTVGTCARYGIGLGLDKEALLPFRSPNTWLKAEEKKRTWWAILILDRFVTLGYSTRTLATQDPQSSDLLPVDDELWEQGGGVAPHSFPLSSASTLYTGRFARLAQATYLLGLVLKFASSLHSNEFQKTEAFQLRRTLHSLIVLSNVEGRTRQLEVCPTNSVCFSALLLLQRSDNLAPDRMLGGGYDDASIVEIISKHGDALAKSVLSSSSRPPEMISPFILHLLYQSATLTAKLCQERNQSIASLEDMKKALTTMGRRWHVANAYLAILNAKEFIPSPPPK